MNRLADGKSEENNYYKSDYFIHSIICRFVVHSPHMGE